MAAIQSVTQQLNESVQAWAVRLNAFLSSLGACSLQDFDLTRRENRSTLQLVAAVTYQSPGSVLAGATAFVGNGTTSGEALANTFLAANPTYRVLFMRDVSNPHRRSLNDDAVLLVYSLSVLSNCAQGECSIMIVEPVADIAPGDTGVAFLVTAAGTSTTSLMVENRSALTWPAGGRGYAAPILGSCTWAGVASCCVASSTSTTTSTSSSSTTSSTSSSTSTSSSSTTSSTSSSTSTSSSSSSTAPPAGPSDITSVVSLDLGYNILVPNQASAEVSFELLTPMAGETVTVFPDEPPGFPGSTTLTVLSGPAAVDNGDGTYTFTFTLGTETVHFQLDYWTVSVSGQMSYICSLPPGDNINGYIPVNAGMGYDPLPPPS
jgi:hypothetical protein